MVEIKQIDNRLTDEWLLKAHYARRKCSRIFSFGLYANGVLEGVITYGMPSNPSIGISFVGKEHSKSVIELNRLCINSTAPRNSASMLVGRSLKMLPKNFIVVSYADEAMNHKGYVYQATNFIYCGTSKSHDSEYFVDGKWTHPRALAGKGITNTATWAKENNIPRKYPKEKHRYIFFLDKKMKFLLKLEQKPYPKGDTRRYDCKDIKIRNFMKLKYHPYSFSSIDSYNTCPHRFKITYIDKIKTGPTLALEKGDYIHRLIEYKLLCECGNRIGLKPQKFNVLTSEDVKLARSTVMAFFRTESFQNALRELRAASSAGIEIKFYLNEDLDACEENDNVLVRGKIDYNIYQNIIDWKTGKLPKYPKKVDQLELYALWFLSKYPQYDWVNTGFWFVEHDHCQWHKIYDKDRDKIKQKFYNYIQTIEQDEEFMPNPSILCNYCSVQYLCPEYKVGD